jgi:hypothetical protein
VRRLHPSTLRFHPANVRAALWALRTARRTRRLLDSGGLDPALAPPPPPRLPAASGRGVRAVLRRLGETCLVNAIVLQAWEAAHGRRRDLVIGTTGPQGFGAHAWLDGDPVVPADDEELLTSSGTMTDGEVRIFSELLRRPAPLYESSEPGPAR